MADTQRRGGKKGSRKFGRSQRPGRRAKTMRNYAGIEARKRKRIAKSNGSAFLEQWERRA